MESSNTSLITQTQKALEASKDPSETYALKYFLADLYRKEGNREAAVRIIQTMIGQEHERRKKNTDHLAALYNNLGLLLNTPLPKEAIEALKQADSYYREREQENTLKIAMVNFRLSELYDSLNDQYYLKKYLKETVLYFDRVKTDKVYEAYARAHHRLGHLYSEQLQLFDAKKHFLKALDIYRAMTPEYNSETQMIIGGILNNIGVTYRDMESFYQAEDYFLKTLDHYQEMETKTRGYLPWIGASMTNLGNLYSGNDKREQATAYTRKAIKVYKHLCKEEPQKYSHYLATALHNLGVLLMDREPESSENYLDQAIAIRKDLCKKEPAAFNADLCSSMMNLVELYYGQWENTLRQDLKEKAISLLSMVKKNSPHLPKHLPAVQNILNDQAYYTDRFNHRDLSDLHLFKITGAILKSKEEVNATIIPGEKIPFQEKIVHQLKEHIKMFPEHSRGKELLADALGEQAWYHLRNRNMTHALRLLEEMQDLQCDHSPESWCNLAHYHLIAGNVHKARRYYQQVLLQKNTVENSIKETLAKDLQALQNEGLLETLPPFLQELIAT